MNPIEIIRIKNFVSFYPFKYKINSDWSVDFYDQDLIFDIKIIHRYFPEIDLNNFEFPFKIGTVDSIRLVNRTNLPVILKSCRNFPNNCLYWTMIDRNLPVKSLEGLKNIGDDLLINFVDWKDYTDKLAIRNKFPDLKIGKSIQFWDDDTCMRKIMEINDKVF